MTGQLEAYVAGLRAREEAEARGLEGNGPQTTGRGRKGVGAGNDGVIRQRKAMQRYAAQEARWTAEEQGAAWGRGETFRSRKELVELLDKAPAALKDAEVGAESDWLLTLRDNNERYVRVGNAFSGLYTKVNVGKVRETETVQRMAPPKAAGGVADGRKLRSSIETMELELSSRRAAVMRPSVDALNLQASSLADVLAGQIARREAEARAEAERAAAASRPAPKVMAPVEKTRERLVVQDARLIMSHGMGEGPSSATLPFKNDSALHVHFRWARVPEEAEPKTGLLSDMSSSDPISRRKFICGQPEGTLAPGEEVSFEFSFDSREAGMWVERWRLTVEEVAVADEEENPFGCEVHTMLTVKAFCDSLEDTFRPTQVERQARFLEAELVRRAVGNVVEDIINGVPIPGEPRPLDEDDPVRDRFNKANFRAFERRARYHYSHAPFFLMQRVAAELLGLMASAEGFTRTTERAAALEDVVEWDWSVLQLDNIVEALSDAENGPGGAWSEEHLREVERLSNKLASLKSRMAAPVVEGEDVHARMLEGILHSLGDLEQTLATRRAYHDAEQETVVANGGKKKKFNDRQVGGKEIADLLGKGLHLFEFPILKAPESEHEDEADAKKKGGKGK